MQKLRIQGPNRLSGTLPASGAKNAALPILAAVLLADEEVELANVPRVRDIHTMLRLLEHLGVTGGIEVGAGPNGEAVTSTRTEREEAHDAPYEIVKTI